MAAVRALFNALGFIYNFSMPCYYSSIKRVPAVAKYIKSTIDST